MAQLFKMHFQGGKELDAVLAGMEKKARRNAVTRTIRKSLSPVVDVIRQRIKTNLSAMNATSRAQYAKTIGISIKQMRNGVLKGSIRAKNLRQDSATSGRMVNFRPLAHLFEGGVSPHPIKQKKRTIQHPGIKGNPVFAGTMDDYKERMVSTFRDELMGQIVKEFNKTGGFVNPYKK